MLIDERVWEFCHYNPRFSRLSRCIGSSFVCHFIWNFQASSGHDALVTWCISQPKMWFHILGWVKHATSHTEAPLICRTATGLKSYRQLTSDTFYFAWIPLKRNKMCCTFRIVYAALLSIFFNRRDFHFNGHPWEMNLFSGGGRIFPKLVSGSVPFTLCSSSTTFQGWV